MSVENIKRLYFALGVSMAVALGYFSADKWWIWK